MFLATSAIHRQYKLNMAREEIIRRAVDAVKFAEDSPPADEYFPYVIKE